MRAKFRTVLERSIKAQIEGLDINFYILDERVYIIDVELSYVLLKLRKNAVLSIKAKCL